MYHQLISVPQLKQLIDSSANNLVLLDASIPPLKGMATPTYSWPNAISAQTQRFDINSNFCDQNSELPHTMPNEQQFTEQAQKLGINQQSQIVVYDHFGLFSSARAWWMFKAMGHHNVAVLNGGLPAWIKAKLAISKGANTIPKQGDFVGKYNNDYFCDKYSVLAATSSTSAQILDARSPARFYGKEPEPRAGVRSGHIPSAINMHYKSLQNDGLLHNKETLQQIFKEHLKKQPLTKTPLIMSCGSGVTACILALAANIIDHTNVQVYDGSWSEWGSDETLPIARD